MTTCLRKYGRKVRITFSGNPAGGALPRPDKAKPKAYKIRIIFGGLPNES